MFKRDPGDGLDHMAIVKQDVGVQVTGVGNLAKGKAALISPQPVAETDTEPNSKSIATLPKTQREASGQGILHPYPAERFAGVKEFLSL